MKRLSTFRISASAHDTLVIQSQRRDFFHIYALFAGNICDIRVYLLVYSLCYGSVPCE
jgi:hypothetical protein